MKQIIDGDVGNKRRTCEFCDTKIRNTQIDEFYQVGIKWRQTDQELINAKASWYITKQKDLKDDIEAEKEAMVIGRAKLGRECVSIENSKNDL